MYYINISIFISNLLYLFFTIKIVENLYIFYNNFNIKKKQNLMDIINFKNDNLTILKQKDENNRIIGYKKYNNIQLIGRNLYYPNILLFDDNKIINPYDEKIMSLNKESFYDNNLYHYEIPEIENKFFFKNNVFFFIYNFDNYYHFIYDTLPYLYTYFELKKIYIDLKILVNYPNKNKLDFYKFNTEFLYKLVNKDDIIIHNKNYIYNNIFVSTSLTHGGLSNKKPRKEIFQIYDKLIHSIDLNNIREEYKNLKYLYISRRTWINNDDSNIGTNYTLRRKMINEDELVKEINKYNYEEIFTENLNTDEKIYIFNKAERIIGPIGGGMVNLLFCNNKTKTYIIISPYFLDINSRFRFSLENTNFMYFYDSKTNKNIMNKYSNYTRVKIIDNKSIYYNKIGEIFSISNNIYNIKISDNDIAGFNSEIEFKTIRCNEKEFIVLDKGLNSPYVFNYNNLLKNIIN